MADVTLNIIDKYESIVLEYDTPPSMIGTFKEHIHLITSTGWIGRNEKKIIETVPDRGDLNLEVLGPCLMAEAIRCKNETAMNVFRSYCGKGCSAFDYLFPKLAVMYGQTQFIQKILESQELDDKGVNIIYYMSKRLKLRNFVRLLVNSGCISDGELDDAADWIRRVHWEPSLLALEQERESRS